MTRLVAVVANSVTTAWGTVSAGRASVVAAVIFAALFAILNGDSSAGEVLIVELLDGLLSVLLVVVLNKGVLFL